MEIMAATLRMLLFGLAFALLCNSNDVNCYGIPKDELKPLTPQELAYYHNKTVYSDVCLDITRPPFDTIGANIKPTEPYIMRDMGKDSVCHECTVRGLYTLHIPDCGLFVARLPALPNHDPVQDHGFLYDIRKLQFDHLQIDCQSCALKTDSGKIVTGSFDSKWPKAAISFVAYKRVWDSEFIHLANVTFIAEIKRDEVEMECKGTEEFKMACEKAHEYGSLDYAVMHAAKYFASDTANKLEIAEAHGMGTPYLAASLNCNSEEHLFEVDSKCRN